MEEKKETSIIKILAKETPATLGELMKRVKKSRGEIEGVIKALAEKEGRVYVNPHLKMMLDEAEYVLRAKCDAENLNFEEEWAKEKAAVTEKYEAEKAAKEAKEAKKADPAKDAETLKEFNEIRKANGRSPISL